VRIRLPHIRDGISLEILGEHNTISVISDEDAVLYGEAKIQLTEGCTYEYEFSDSAIGFKEDSKNNKIVTFSKFGRNKGTLVPNIYVGTHSLEIEDSDSKLPIEVRSIKSEYRSDYRYMIESITEQCTELVMQIDSPISQHFEPDFDIDGKTLYQRFSFVKALMDSQEFEEAVQLIISNPTTTWHTAEESKDIRRIKRFNPRNIRQIIGGGHRMQIPHDHPLYQSHGLPSLPHQVKAYRKVESVDTAENRFVKRALEEFLFYCEHCEAKFEKYSRAKSEAQGLSNKLRNLLNLSFFREISRPTSLKLNSPVLQRRSGYREVLSAWLKFPLAAKLTWRGGDDVYDVGKRDVAVLYEYWLFFTLLDLLSEIFEIEPRSIQQLVRYEMGNLSLSLRQGSSIALKGVHRKQSRGLNIQFSYNRSFGGGREYPAPGSYTTTLRPDFTLSIWPEQIASAREAEIQELITHIHFDAKYKINNFYELISSSKEEILTEEENDQLIKEEIEETVKGTYKNQDLLKMHAYKDAIRRTGGAYVLYPGEGREEPFRGFHEIVPGLGAFVVKPNIESRRQDHLRAFIMNVVEHLVDRASQREHTAIKVYDIHRYLKPDSDKLQEPLPEYVSGRKLIPNETFVLVGYYRSKDHLDWILQNRLYNFRAGLDKGSLPLGPKEVRAEFIILHGPKETETGKIYQLTGRGPKIFSKQNLIEKKYPTTPTGEIYLIYELETEVSDEFKHAVFDLRRLQNYDRFWNSPKPIAVSLEELMKTKRK
jgi:predicted component of viral defense system (DUF524 family)